MTGSAGEACLAAIDFVHTISLAIPIGSATSKGKPLFPRIDADTVGP